MDDTNSSMHPFEEGMCFVRGSDMINESEDCHIEETKLQFDKYHFKVMMLETYEDTHQTDNVRVMFHFYHPLIRRPDMVGEEINPIWNYEESSV